MPSRVHWSARRGRTAGHSRRGAPAPHRPRRLKVTGRLWRRRFGSGRAASGRGGAACADAPVRAGLTAQAAAWPWSPAGAAKAGPETRAASDGAGPPFDKPPPSAPLGRWAGGVQMRGRVSFSVQLGPRGLTGDSSGSGPARTMRRYLILCEIGGWTQPPRFFSGLSRGFSRPPPVSPGRLQSCAHQSGKNGD